MLAKVGSVRATARATGWRGEELMGKKPHADRNADKILARDELMDVQKECPVIVQVFRSRFPIEDKYVKE